MKQVVFAIALLAMASLTGCLNTEDSPVDENIDTTDDSTSDTTEDNSDTTEDTKDDELIEPVGTDGGYTPPEDSSIRMDSGQRGYWIYHPDSEYVLCTKQGYHSYDDGTVAGEKTIYCDLDNRHDSGPQIWVNKTEKTVTVECIKHHSGDYCKNYPWMYSEKSIYLLFYSQEGFTERIKVDLMAIADDDDAPYTYFFKNEVTLQFEPVWFSVEESSTSELYFPEHTDSRVF